MFEVAKTQPALMKRNKMSYVILLANDNFAVPQLGHSRKYTTGMIRIGTPLHLQGLRFQTMERFPEPTERNIEQHGRIEK